MKNKWSTKPGQEWIKCPHCEITFRRKAALATAPPPVDANVNSQIMVALEESIKLQSHYAGILNNFDGGKRIQFSNAAEWITRMKEIGKLATAPPDKATRKDETMNLIEKPTPQEEKNFENWLEATNSDGLRAAIIKLRDAANAEVKVCPEVALRCFQEGRVQMAQNILELVPDPPQPASAGALDAKLTDLTHTRSCPLLNPMSMEFCTCGLEWRIKLRTEMEMHNAWRKRAEEAEAALAAHDQKVRREVLEEAGLHFPLEMAPWRCVCGWIADARKGPAEQWREHIRSLAPGAVEKK